MPVVAQPAHHLLEVVPAVLRLRARNQPLRLVEPSLEGAARVRRVGRFDLRRIEDDVRLLDQGAVQVEQLMRSEPCARQLDQLRVTIRGEPVEMGMPERDLELLLLGRLQLAKARIDARLHRSLPQQPRTEGVNRTDEGAIDLAQRALQP